jgi:NarL family two-component system response regulator LiaR
MSDNGSAGRRRSRTANRGPVTVIVADGDPLARRAIRESLQDEGMTVIAEAGTGREAIDLALHYHPQALVLDVQLPDLHAIDVTRRVRRGGGEDVVVVVLAPSDDDETALAVLRAGAVGWLAKDMALDGLPRAVQGAVDGEAAVSRQLLRPLIEQLQREQAEELGLRPVRSPLSQREWEVLDLVCHGASGDEIAMRLEIAPGTVRSHIKHIQRKTGARGRKELLAVARRLRVARLEPSSTASPIG